MARNLQRLIFAGLGLAGLLAGCSPGPMIDRLPSEMGLPAGTPARPATPYQYPAVHDMPPPRSTAPMTEEEQLKVENELTAARNRQAGGSPPGKKATPATKKKPAAGNNGQGAGGKAGAKDGVKTNP